jgi:ribosome-associated protein
MIDPAFEREKSKSQRKRDHHALQALAHALVQLSARQLKKIKLEETTRAEIVAARTLQRGALQRQLRYLAGLLEHEDSDGIRATLDAIHAPERANVKALHEVERMRDEILQAAEVAIPRVLGRFPHADEALLRRLARDAEYQTLALLMTEERSKIEAR